MIQQSEVTIEGTSPLLMNRYPEGPVEGLDKKPKEEQAEIAAYRHPDTGDLYVPGVNIQRGLVSAARFSKGKGRASLQLVVAACVMVQPERVSLGKHDFTVDSRRVVIRATKGAVIRHRPRLDNWKLTFTLDFDDTLLTAVQVRKIVDDMGTRVGLGDFRPEKTGPFGRFVVIEWKHEPIAANGKRKAA